MDDQRPRTKDQRPTTDDQRARADSQRSTGHGPGSDCRPRRILLASRNAGKLAELRALLADLPIEVNLPEGMPEVEETGATFVENAVLKARAVAEWSGEWALADDSGLEVDALDGRPGVLSSRYGSPGATDADRNALLLAELAGVPETARSARFRCALALAAPDGRVWTTEGSCEGRIAFEPRGEHGFGYDPIFYLPDLHRTFGEQAAREKAQISHRARALRAMRELLSRLGG
jgi:XTP/dITP diphosphohydrolase